MPLPVSLQAMRLLPRQAVCAHAASFLTTVPAV